MSSNVIKVPEISGQHFKVEIHADLVDELDNSFSPMDGIVAIGQIFGALPKVHRRSTEQNERQVGRSVFRVYTGRFHWYPIGFTYVQIDSVLRVLEFWYDEEYHGNRTQELDSVIGDPSDDEEYICPSPRLQTTEEK